MSKSELINAITTGKLPSLETSILPAVPQIEIITNTDLPERSHPSDSCVDLRAIIDEPISLTHGEQVLVDTGIRVRMPESPPEFNWVLEIMPRSGHANKSGITVTNSPGQIDEGYTGKVMVIVRNTKKFKFIIEKGMKIAQMKLTKSYNFDWVKVESFDSTERGVKGFGSTGE